MYISKQRDISQPNRKYILYPSLIQFSLAPIFPASLSVHLVIITCQTNPIKSLSQQDKSSPASSPLLQSCLVSAQQRREEWSTHCWTDILYSKWNIDGRWKNIWRHNATVPQFSRGCLSCNVRVMGPGHEWRCHAALHSALCHAVHNTHTLHITHWNTRREIWSKLRRFRGWWLRPP